MRMGSIAPEKQTIFTRLNDGTVQVWHMIPQLLGEVIQDGPKSAPKWKFENRTFSSLKPLEEYLLVKKGLAPKRLARKQYRFAPGKTTIKTSEGGFFLDSKIGYYGQFECFRTTVDEDKNLVLLEGTKDQRMRPSYDWSGDDAKTVKWEIVGQADLDPNKPTNND